MSVELGSRGRTQPTSTRGASAQVGVFFRIGEYWTIGLGTAKFPIKEIKGLGYLQRLLQHPDKEFHALDLLSSVGGLPASDTLVGPEEALPVGLAIRPGLTGDAGEMLDAQAKSEYQRRLRELHETLEDQRERGNQERADQIEGEMEFIAQVLNRATGRSGRDRRTGSNAERARLSVTRAIKTALEKIAEQHTALGETLDREIRTGSFCSYVPDRTNPILWHFSPEGAVPAVEVPTAGPISTGRATSFLRRFTEGTSFVGREDERAVLIHGLKQALQGQGKFFLISGAAGAGKTRVAAEIAMEASSRGMRIFVGSCYERDDPVPFIAFVEILESALALMRDPTAFREMLGDDASEIVRLLPQLRRSFPDIPPPVDLPPEQARRMLFNAVTGVMTRVSRASPALFILDDLHWADEGTLLLLSHVAQVAPTVPVLIIGTYRDFETDPHGRFARTLDELIRHHLVESISLAGLSESSIVKMLTALSGREPPASAVRLFHSYTDGNPFFVEELYRHLAEQGELIDSGGNFRSDLKLGDAEVPHSARVTIGRRLARLREVTLKVLGVAAVIGRSFTFDLLGAATRAEPEALLDCVEEAESAGLISSALQYPAVRFQFSHDLFRQSVIGGLSVTRRQVLHLEIADAIERLFGNELEAHVNDLAHHLWQAGAGADGGRTARYLDMAARRALDQGALTETEGFYHQALDVLNTIPESPERDRQELALQLAIGQTYMATRGYVAPETVAAYDRASVLGDRLGNPSQVMMTLTGMFAIPLLRGEMEATRALADRVHAAAKSEGGNATITWGLFLQGVAAYHRGDLVYARERLEESIERYHVEDHSDIPQDPGTEALEYMALTLWQLGMADRARERMVQAATLAARLRKPYALAHLRFYEGFLAVHLRDPEATRKAAEATVAMAREQSIRLFHDLAQLLLGWSFAQLGRCDEGIVRAREALANYLKAGNRNSIATFLGLLAETQACCGAFGEARATIEEALVASPGQLVDLPYALWFRGELLFGRCADSKSASAVPSADMAGAEQNFRDSILLANRLGAKTLALRAATSLARLLIASGRTDGAHQLIAPLWRDFTEGWDTRDLIEARALVQ